MSRVTYVADTQLRVLRLFRTLMLISLVEWEVIFFKNFCVSIFFFEIFYCPVSFYATIISEILSATAKCMKLCY